MYVLLSWTSYLWYFSCILLISFDIYTLFFLCVCIVGCHICITFLNKLPLINFSLNVANVGECCKARRVCVDQRIALCKSSLLLLLKSSETCGVTNYDSSCRKDVVNRCLKFAWMAHCSRWLVERDNVSLSSAADSITPSLCSRQSSQLRSAPNLPVKMSHHRRPIRL